MGYGLPAAIGACFAAGLKRVVCFEGDGSIQLNIHELQIIKHYNLPIKLFIYSNDGYLSIRNTQKNLFEGRLVASDTKSGVSCPDFVKVAKAYGLPAIRINNHQDMEEKIRTACDARENPDFMIIIRTDSRAINSLEDAIERANRYIKAGADVIFPEALESKREFEIFAKEVKTPLMANMTEFGKTPYMSVREFEDMGYSIVIFPLTAFRVAMKAIEEALTELKKTGTQKGFIDRMQTREELYKLLRYEPGKT